MKVNMSNLIEDIYLNLFALGLNIELQIMTICVHLSMYLIFVLNLSPFKLFNAGSKVSKTGSIRHIDLKTSGRETRFSLLKEE